MASTWGAAPGGTICASCWTAAVSSGITLSSSDSLLTAALTAIEVGDTIAESTVRVNKRIKQSQLLAKCEWVRPLTTDLGQS